MAAPINDEGKTCHNSRQMTWRASPARIEQEDRTPNTVTTGTMIFIGSTRASSGIVTAPKPALPRIA